MQKKWTKNLAIVGFVLGIIIGAMSDNFYGLHHIEDIAFLLGSSLPLVIIFSVIGFIIDYLLNSKVVGVQQRNNLNKQALTGYFSKPKNYLLLAIPAVLVVAYFLDLKPNSNQSEVDKCVNSSMAAWDVKQERIKKEWSEWNAWKNDGKWKNDQIISKNEGGGRDFSLELFGPEEKVEKRSRIEIESEWRVYCMKINSGK